MSGLGRCTGPAFVDWHVHCARQCIKCGGLLRYVRAWPLAAHGCPRRGRCAMTGDEAPVQHEVGVQGQARRHAFDTSRAHQARMYDYFLGGKDNYAADREAAEAWLKIDPKAAFSSPANR